MPTTYTRQHAVQYDQSSAPYIASAICRCHPGRRSLHVVYAGGWRIDWPVKVNGRVLYDWPEAVPASVKRLVERAFTALEEEKQAR